MDSKKRALSLLAKVASAAALAAAIALAPSSGQACDNPNCKGGEACAKAHDGKEGCACPGECKMGDKCDGKNCPCAEKKKEEGSCGSGCGCSGGKDAHDDHGKDAHDDQGKHEGHDKQDNHGKKEPAVENDASPSRGAGLRAVIDPSTGEFIAPESGDASAAAMPAAARPASAPVEIAMADGGVMAPFPADRAGAVVAAVADGRPQASCTH